PCWSHQPNPLRNSFLAHFVFFQERPVFKFLESFLKFRLRIHNNRSVPRNGLIQRFSGNEKETDTVFTGADADLVSFAKNDESPVFRFLLGFAKFTVSTENICKRVVVRLNGNGLCIPG